jgi:hypothetical protein
VLSFEAGFNKYFLIGYCEKVVIYSLVLSDIWRRNSECVGLLVIQFCFLDFRRAGWGVGPCGGVVKPDVVALIGGDEEESYYQHVQRGVTLGGLFEERAPFSDECCDFRDSSFYFCEVYRKLENEFVGENERVRKTFGENLSLLGSDSDDDDRASVEDLGGGGRVNIHEENIAGRLVTEGVQNLVIERLEIQEAEDGGISGRKTWEEVVTAIDPNFIEDTRRITDCEVLSEDDVTVLTDGQFEEAEISVSAVVKGRVVECDLQAVHHEPGPFSEDVDDDDFSCTPRASLFFSFRDEQCEEVSLFCFYFVYQWCFVLLNILDKDSLVMTGVMLRVGWGWEVYLFFLVFLTGSVGIWRSRGTDCVGRDV